MSPIRHDNRRLDSVVGKTIFEYADTLRVRVPTSCNRSGECHECIVEIRQGEGALNSPTHEEAFLRDNYRLACQAYVTDPEADVEFVILRRQPRILTQTIKRSVPLVPSVTRRDDGVYFHDDRIDSYKGRIYGLAIDVGTTTVVMNLVDLESGDVLHTASFENPQRFGGSDIMHRISYDGGEFHGELQQVMLSSLNFEIGWMARELGFHRRNIYEVVIVGNSTMRDILFGIDVQSIGEKPYKSMVEHEMLRSERETTAIHTTASELGLRVFPRAHVYGGPLIASHVGADVTADLLAIGMDEQDDVVMLLDVGTNTEVVVGNKHRIMAASCPAGPAFEGGEVMYGMPGYVGAVESVKLTDDSCECQTIGQADAQGICGSGLIDLLAELRRTEKMNRLGVFADGSQAFHLPAREGHDAFKGRHQRARAGKVGQLLRPIHRPSQLRRSDRENLQALPGGRIRQLHRRSERGQHRFRRQLPAEQDRKGRQRLAGGGHGHAPQHRHARGRREHDPQRRAHRA